MSRAIITVRILALVCLALGLMCAGLALAWQDQREQTACWRTAAQFQQVPPDDCGRESLLGCLSRPGWRGR